MRRQCRSRVASVAAGCLHAFPRRSLDRWPRPYDQTGRMPMKPTFSACFASLFALLLSATATLAHADEASDFVDDASARGVAEIEMAKLALKESQAQDVKNFAQMMIDDHTKANQKLKEIAQQKNMEVADDPSLMARAKQWIRDW